jgi:uncharacterized membrane protein
MTANLSAHDKSLAERIFHAFLYEAVAVLICTPLFAWLMNQPIERMGILNVAISLIAMIWHMVVTVGQDRLLAALPIRKTLAVRIAHGIVFEGGLTVFAITLAAWWLGIGYWQAFLLDAGLLLFFLPYAVVYNSVYDALRVRLVGSANGSA